MKLYTCRLFVILMMSRCIISRGLNTDERFRSQLLNPFGPIWDIAPDKVPGALNGLWLSRKTDNGGLQSTRLEDKGDNHRDSIEVPLTDGIEGNYVAAEDSYNIEDYGYERRTLGDKEDNVSIRSVGRPIATIQSLCQSVLTPVFLNSSVYRQERYDEITCLHPYEGAGKSPSKHNKVCEGAGFVCVQRYRRILLLKRTDVNSCYETESRNINAGCECVWPRHILSGIKDYHD